MLSDQNARKVSYSASRASNGIFARKQHTAETPTSVVQTCLKALQVSDAAPYYKMIYHYPELLFLRCPFSDSAGRAFENISIFEYLCWSLNADLLKKLVPVASASSLLTECLQNQWNEFYKRGVTYRLQENLLSETMFNAGLLFNKLFDYVSEDEKSRDHQLWVEGVGLQQKRLPINLLKRFYGIANAELTFYMPDLFRYTEWNESEVGDKRALQYDKKTAQLQAVRRGNKDCVMDNVEFICAEWLETLLETRSAIAALIAEPPQLEPIRQGCKI